MHKKKHSVVLSPAEGRPREVGRKQLAGTRSNRKVRAGNLEDTDRGSRQGEGDTTFLRCEVKKKQASALSVWVNEFVPE